MEFIRFIKGVGEAIFNFFSTLFNLDWSVANHETVYWIVGFIIVFLLLKRLVIEFFTLPAVVVKQLFARLAEHLSIGIGKGLRWLAVTTGRILGRGSVAAYQRLLKPGAQKSYSWLQRIWYRWRPRLWDTSPWFMDESSSRSFQFFLNTYQRWKSVWKERLTALRTQIWYQLRFR